jgi:hypothetical protein
MPVGQGALFRLSSNYQFHVTVCGGPIFQSIIRSRFQNFFLAGSEQWETVLEIRDNRLQWPDLSVPRNMISKYCKVGLNDLEWALFLCGEMDRSSWDKDGEKDLAVLVPREKRDTFSDWIAERLIPAFHNRIGKKFKVVVTIFFKRNVFDMFKRPISEELGIGLYDYKETMLHRTSRIVTTVVASILPLCSVILLYVIENNAVRLGVIVVLSALFSLALALMTNSRTIEIFAATSA